MVCVQEYRFSIYMSVFHCYNRPFIVLHASSIYPVNSPLEDYYNIIYIRVAIYIHLHSTLSSLILHSSLFANKYSKALCPFSNTDRYLASECVHEIPLMNKTDEQSYMRIPEGLISLGEPLHIGAFAGLCLYTSGEDGSGRPAVRPSF